MGVADEIRSQRAEGRDPDEQRAGIPRQSSRGRDRVAGIAWWCVGWAATDLASHVATPRLLLRLLIRSCRAATAYEAPPASGNTPCGRFVARERSAYEVASHYPLQESSCDALSAPLLSVVRGRAGEEMRREWERMGESWRGLEGIGGTWRGLKRVGVDWRGLEGGEREVSGR